MLPSRALSPQPPLRPVQVPNAIPARSGARLALFGGTMFSFGGIE